MAYKPVPILKPSIKGVLQYGPLIAQAFESGFVFANDADEPLNPGLSANFAVRVGTKAPRIQVIVVALPPKK